MRTKALPEHSAPRADLNAGGTPVTAFRGELSIVIPGYNEEQAIADILDRVFAEVDHLNQQAPEDRRCEVVVVNDCSTDRTAEIVARRPGVTLINCARNQGY